MNIHEMSSLSGLCPTTLIKGLRDLEDSGLLEIERNPSSRYPHKYTYLGPLKSREEISLEERCRNLEKELAAIELKRKYLIEQLEQFKDFCNRVYDIQEKKDHFVLLVCKDASGKLGIPMRPKII
jgi:DNA-binding HxlR family transcriptional regulator